MTGGRQGRREPEEGGEPIAATVDHDEFYRLLARPPRRRVLYYLQEHSTASVAELCDVLAGWEALDRSRTLGDEARDRIRCRLYHADLPKLDRAGVVSYDADEGAVTLSAVLQRAREYDARTHRI
jgi:hypothetical protein